MRKRRRFLCLFLALLFCMIGITSEASESYDIGKYDFITASEFRAKLPETMQEYADEIIQASYDYRINPYFIASIMILESGSCTSKVFRNKNNAFGWRGKNGYMAFGSPEECIDYCSGKIREKYIDKGFDTLDLVGPRYCNEDWAKYIKNVWEGISNEQEKDLPDRNRRVRSDRRGERKGPDIRQAGAYIRQA